AVGWSCAVAFFGVFLSPPLRKQVIIEEQLAFPSGTATGQLISVLHQLPPPETNVRHRRGYNALASTEDDESIAYIAEPHETDALRIPEAEVPEKEGWSALSWSFAASGVMTHISFQ
ncbi:hypothetical protein FKP32DRAFT_1670650, partial [Trametes sanguinea]